MKTYHPRRGDVIWIAMAPHAGHEQGGHRPALVLSPVEYNRRTGMAVMCPITSRRKGYAFEVAIPPGLKVSGTILVDHVKNMDWSFRGAEFVAALPEATLKEVSAKLRVLVG